jgi:hypothetical protein
VLGGGVNLKLYAVLSFDTDWSWVDSLTPRSLNPPEKAPMLIAQNDGWNSVLVCAVWRSETKHLCCQLGIEWRFSSFAVCVLVSIPI